jgi:hypothetical protein
MDNARMAAASRAYHEAYAAAKTRYDADGDHAAFGRAAKAAADQLLAERDAVYAPVDAMLERIDDEYA